MPNPVPRETESATLTGDIASCRLAHFFANAEDLFNCAACYADCRIRELVVFAVLQEVGLFCLSPTSVHWAYRS